MKAHSFKKHGEVNSVNPCAAYLGFRERGYEISFFGDEGPDVAGLTSDTVVVGGVPWIHRVLRQMGRPVPTLDAVPLSLAPLAGRRTWQATLGEVRQRVDAGQPVFVKPAPDQTKAFAGHVARHYGDLAITAGLPADLMVSCAEPLDLRAEYRVFLCHGEILGCKHYHGDFRLTPDFAAIDAAVAAYTDAPAGCSLDFAVTAEGKTVLIEVNDGYALGAYGLNPMLYAGLLAARWHEMTVQVA